MPETGNFDDGTFADFRSGKPAAVEKVRQWVSVVVNHPGWRLADSESVAQDILVKLVDIGRSGRFHGDSSFRTFVISVARHTCVDAYRKQRWRARLEQVHAAEVQRLGEDDGPVAHQRSRERRELLKYVFQRLPEECRRLWGLLYGQGLAAREAAERLGINENNVRVRAHRCLRKARGIARGFLAQGT